MKNNSKNIERQTPITDGDTRPDENIEGNVKQNSSPVPSDKNAVTKERAADVNTMDDYKDAKK